MSTEERIAKLEEFAADVRSYTQILTEMLRRHDERIDEHDTLFRATDEKIAALTDAQIKTEEALTRLIERVDKLTAALEQHTADGHGGRR
ncbi:MAG: hypothetical protein DMF64_14790 [Acidobacteria bacterium]|nr:MAG: hypothetical protein DMF64_14790 [Acidobacteriota bacterium]